MSAVVPVSSLRDSAPTTSHGPAEQIKKQTLTVNCKCGQLTRSSGWHSTIVVQSWISSILWGSNLMGQRLWLLCNHNYKAISCSVLVSSSCWHWEYCL